MGIGADEPYDLVQGETDGSLKGEKMVDSLSARVFISLFGRDSAPLLEYVPRPYEDTAHRLAFLVEEGQDEYGRWRVHLCVRCRNEEIAEWTVMSVYEPLEGEEGDPQCTYRTEEWHLPLPYVHPPDRPGLYRPFRMELMVSENRHFCLPIEIDKGDNKQSGYRECQAWNTARLWALFPDKVEFDAPPVYVGSTEAAPYGSVEATFRYLDIETVRQAWLANEDSEVLMPEHHDHGIPSRYEWTENEPLNPMNRPKSLSEALACARKHGACACSNTEQFWRYRHLEWQLDTRGNGYVSYYGSGPESWCITARLVAGQVTEIRENNGSCSKWREMKASTMSAGAFLHDISLG